MNNVSNDALKGLKGQLAHSPGQSEAAFAIAFAFALFYTLLNKTTL